MEQQNFFHLDGRSNMRQRATDLPDFDRFWAKYPRHDGKLAAIRKWTRIKPSADLVEKILAALEWQCQRWTDPEYVPHAATYLHNARWEDEPRKTPQINLLSPRPAWECPHVDRCANADQCRQSTILDRARKAHAS